MVKQIQAAVKVDAAIIGAGPAGLAAAIEARRQGLTAVVLDKGDGRAQKIGETIQGECRYSLERLGLWDKFLAAGHLVSYGTSSRWGSDETGYNDFLFHAHGNGRHLDRARFEAMMADHARAQGAVIHYQTRLKDCRRINGRWRITAKYQAGDAFKLNAGFVIDAAGRQAAFSIAQGSQKVLHDHLVGVFQFFEADEQRSDGNTYSLVEARPEGWWYSALLPDKRMVAGFMTDSDIVNSLKLKDKDNWTALLQDAPASLDRLQGRVSEGAPRVVPAYSHVLDKVAGPGWCAAGDAASTFDPLSSQGIFKALRSGMAAAETAKGWLNGETMVVDSYQADIQNQFEEYLQLRMGFYRREQRWPKSRFWARRHQRITLHPANQLVLGGSRDFAGLNMHLPTETLKALCSCFSRPAPAWRGLKLFKANHDGGESDERLIHALQYLVHKRALVAANP